jgi:hypothetical protein
MLLNDSFLLALNRVIFTITNVIFILIYKRGVQCVNVVLMLRCYNISIARQKLDSLAHDRDQ